MEKLQSQNLLECQGGCVLVKLVARAISKLVQIVGRSLIVR